MDKIRRSILIRILAFIVGFALLEALALSQAADRIVENLPHRSEPAVEITIPEALPEKAEVDPNEILAAKISNYYKKPLETVSQIVEYSKEFAHEEFPTQRDILAIIAVESSFNPEAKFQGSRGLMQVLVKTHAKRILGPFDVREQIRVGTEILREYYLQTGKVRDAAVMAYNVGPGAYQKGVRPDHYLSKFRREVAWLE